MNEGGGGGPFSTARGSQKRTIHSLAPVAVRVRVRSHNIKATFRAKKKNCKSWHEGADGQPQPSDVLEVPRM